MIAAKLNNLQRYTGKTGKQTAVGPYRTTGPTQAVNADKFKTPKLTGPAPQAPAAAAAAAPLDPLRPDSIYETALSNIRTGLGNNEAALTADENALGTNYGVAFDRDGQGQATNFRLDYTNPFSKASLLQQAFDTQNRANTNSYAARGQLYAGSLQNAKDATVRSNQQGQHELLTGFGGTARSIFMARLNARNEALNAQNAAAAELRDRNISGGPPPAPAAAPAATAPAQAGNQLQQLIAQHGANNVKWTDRGLFYKRASDGKWIPVR